MQSNLKEKHVQFFCFSIGCSKLTEKLLRTKILTVLKSVEIGNINENKKYKAKKLAVRDESSKFFNNIFETVNATTTQK